MFLLCFLIPVFHYEHAKALPRLGGVLIKRLAAD
jgi:hypothetical protein